MKIFGNTQSDAAMNVIRCDQEEYLVWKWRPKNAQLGESVRENAIRIGSALRVKQNEVAVFVYSRNDERMDFIEGPFDGFLQTMNLPVLSDIIGKAYAGDTPFQAEIYFINLQENNQLSFAAPYFGVTDPRFPDLAVPVAVRGMLTFTLRDYRNFIKLNRLRDFTLESFQKQIRAAIVKSIKQIVAKLPSQQGVSLVQIEQHTEQINAAIGAELTTRLKEFGVEAKAVDVDAVEPDRESAEYRELVSLTQGIAAETARTQAAINLKNLADLQEINKTNTEESLRIQREEAQRAQRLQTEQTFIGAHALDRQADVLQAMAQGISANGGMSGGEGGGGFNPAVMMTGMMVGGAMGQQAAGMMGQMGQMASQGLQTPPAPTALQYFVAVNGAATGPFTTQQLAQMAAAGTLTLQSQVWRQGMETWQPVAAMPELAALFAPTPPPPAGSTPPPVPTA